MQKELAVKDNQAIKCSDLNPHNGPMMLDDVVITAKTTMLMFTEDLGTVITAHRA